jgi:hypothetical protein
MTVKCKLQKETEDEGLGVLEPEGDEDKREGELQMKARGQQKRQTREGRIMKTRMRSQSNRKVMSRILMYSQTSSVRHSHERLTQRHIKFMWFWSQSEFISDFNKHTSHLHFWMNFSSNENRLFLILVKSFR